MRVLTFLSREIPKMAVLPFDHCHLPERIHGYNNYPIVFAFSMLDNIPETSVSSLRLDWNVMWEHQFIESRNMNLNSTTVTIMAELCRLNGLLITRENHLGKKYANVLVVKHVNQYTEDLIEATEIQVDSLYRLLRICYPNN